MELSNFEALVAKVKGEPRLRRVALVEAQDEHALEAVLAARADGLVEPVLIGRRNLIEAALAKLASRAYTAAVAGSQQGSALAGDASGAAGVTPGAGAPEIVETENEAASAAAGCRLVREGAADFLMKGKLQTAELLRAVVDRESGLRTGSVMSHIAFFGVPGRGKFLVATDGGMLLRPDLAQKKQIIENAAGALRALGYANPKVAVLAAVETVNEKMPETVDAAELKRMNLAGEIAGCTVEGPISYDLAVNHESAEAKGYSSPVAGLADILVVPDIASGNILGKCLVYSAKARMAGFVAGATVPIVLTSRGASAEEKYPLAGPRRGSLVVKNPPKTGSTTARGGLDPERAALPSAVRPAPIPGASAFRVGAPVRTGRSARLRGDLAWAAGIAAVAVFLLAPPTHALFVAATSAHPFLVAFAKFCLLATMGELLAIRIIAGAWFSPKGLAWRALVWGILGMVIVIVFEIFGSGVKAAMARGLLPGGDSKFLFAFFVSSTMNLSFAPTMMMAHRFTDTLIDMKYERGGAGTAAGHGGASRAATGPGASIGVADIVARIDWKSYVGFVLFRTIPLFWIPAHTITFLLPPEYRVLAAAFLSIALGAILAFAKKKSLSGPSRSGNLSSASQAGSSPARARSERSVHAFPERRTR